MAGEKEKWVDPLERFIIDHKYVSEYLSDFEKVSEFSHNPRLLKSPEFDEFLENYFFRHFAFESAKIFPVLIRKTGDPAAKELVLELQDEHEKMLGKVSELRSRLKESGSEEGVLTLAREVLYELLQHGAREDDELLPLIKKYRKLF